MKSETGNKSGTKQIFIVLDDTYQIREAQKLFCIIIIATLCWTHVIIFTYSYTVYKELFITSSFLEYMITTAQYKAQSYTYITLALLHKICVFLNANRKYQTQIEF